MMPPSEPARPAPDAHVLEWLLEAESADLALSVLTIGEIGRGVARMADGTWVAVFGNGYNSLNQRAVLYIVRLADGVLL